MNLSLLAIDLAKSVFQLHGVDSSGKVVLQKRLSRERLIEFIANLPRCTIAMEACGGANYWGREFEKLGHTVRLISPQFVKPYVKSNKNDSADAAAIAEAASRPHMRFVPVKRIEQQDIQGLHRVRERLVKSRTALVNEIRGLLGEYGIVLPTTVRKLRSLLPTILTQQEPELTSMSRDLFSTLLEELSELDQRIARLEERLEAIYQSHPACQRLSKIPGVGPMTATALLAAVSDPQSFKNGRQFAAWLGLVPKQHSSGGKERLLGISKRGDVYLRKLLIHGARSVAWRVKDRTDSRSLWVQSLIERRGVNRAAVALANKNARIIWTLLAKETNFVAPV